MQSTARGSVSQVPRSGCRNQCDGAGATDTGAGDSRRRASFDPFDALHGTVEQEFLVDASTVVGIAGRRHGERVDWGHRQLRFEENTAANMHQFSTSRVLAACFDGHDVAGSLFDRLTRKNAQRVVLGFVENHSLQNAEVIAAVKGKSGVPVQRPLGKPFEQQRQRHHRPAIENVTPQDRHLIDTEHALERRLHAVVGGSADFRDLGDFGRLGFGKPRTLAQDQDLNREEDARSSRTR